jgi:hypothetical protein
MKERMEGFVLAFVLILSECVRCGYIGLDWNEHWHGVWSVVVVMENVCVFLSFRFQFFKIEIPIVCFISFCCNTDSP